MKFDLNWLKEHIEGDVDADELSEALTHCGFLVETRDAAGSSEIWDVEVTTNRPDAMNHHGLAREAAVALNRPLVPLSCAVTEDGPSAHELATVRIDSPELCRRYCARVLQGARLVESPEWLKRRLDRCGVRSINAVVDATNYVLLNTGQPLHAFDLDTLADRTVIVRAAAAGETVTTLDGEERKLEAGDPIIADPKGPIALAGIMGGADTEIGDSTVNVLLESANFEPLSVRRTVRRLGMHTEASHRFERGADPEMAVAAADMAAQLIADLTGATICKGVVDENPRPWSATELSFNVGRLSRFAGLDITSDDMVRILSGLELEPRLEGDEIACTIPSHRIDIERAADLYEEIIRHVGYGAVPAVLPPMGTPPGHRHRNWRLVDRGRRAAVRCGLIEAVTYAFIDSNADARYASWPLSPGAPIHLGNPLASTQATMRRSLVPGLLAAARDSMNQGERNITLFEQGRVFGGADSGAVEPERLALVLAGQVLIDERDADFFVLKGVVDALSCDAGLSIEAWRRGGDPWLNENESALLIGEGGSVVGLAGRLSDCEAEPWGFKVPVYLAEISLQEAVEAPLPEFVPLPRFPSVSADITVEHDVTLAYAELEHTARDLADDMVEEIRLTARYQGKGLPKNAVRSTMRVVYRHPERSLTQDEVNQLQDGLRTALAEHLSVKLT